MTTTASDDDKTRIVSIAEALRRPHPWTFDEAESIVAALLASGFSARSYKRKPAGYEVRVSGRRGGQRFAYTIKTWPEYLDLEGLITRGLTGADKIYTEGE